MKVRVEGDLRRLSKKVADSIDLEKVVRSLYDYYASKFDQELIDVAFQSGIKEEDFYEFVRLVWGDVSKRLKKRLNIKEE